MTGYTVVVRESEWDDLERDKMLALTQYEAGICDCGLHESVADRDPEIELVTRRCPICAGLAQQMRVMHDKDHRAEERLKDQPGAVRPADGRKVRMREKPPIEPSV